MFKLSVSFSGELPSHWEKMPLHPMTKNRQSLHCVPLDPSSVEYIEVKAAFDKTMTPATYSGYSAYRGSYYSSVVKILRIQNPILYAQYIARKKAMDKHNKPGHENERRLFHGTSEKICSEINRNGFNRSHAGKHGNTMHDKSYNLKLLICSNIY